jgi:hypothetical protein
MEYNLARVARGTVYTIYGAIVAEVMQDVVSGTVFLIVPFPFSQVNLIIIGLKRKLIHDTECCYGN